MFDDLQKQPNNQQQENKPTQPIQDVPQQPVAPKEDVSQRIEKLKEKGVKQSRRKKLYLIIGIVVISLFAGGVVGAGYFFWNDIANIINERFNKDTSDELILLDEWKVCSQDLDCVETQEGCCNCANGGIQMAINKQYLDEWQNILDNSCQDVGCLAFVNCKQGSIICENDKCKFKEEKGEADKKIACPMDAKVCPDGSSVGRVPPDCEFAKCPVVEESIENEIGNKTSDTSDLSPEVSATDDWQTYRNEEYKFEMKYLSNWLFNSKSVGGTDNFLDIHLSNIQVVNGPGCPEKYIGLEIQVGHVKDTKVDFTTFVQSQVKSGIGLQPSGKLEEMSISIYKGYKVENSGWDSGCVGPGYFIEQDEDRYVYIFSGGNIENYNITLNQILSSFKFLQDTDNDGLFDDEEAKYGTNPNNPDSDGDGYLDGDEVENGYNPMGEGRL